MIALRLKRHTGQKIRMILVLMSPTLLYLALSFVTHINHGVRR